MKYIEASLVPGEVVIHQTRLHWVVMLGHILTGCVLLAAAAALLLFELFGRQGMGGAAREALEGASAALLAAGLLTILIGMVRRYATEIAVTNRRVVVKQGLLSRRTIEMLLNKVETIEVSEPTMGRLMGYGTIVIIGTGGTSEPFQKIAHPLEFRSHVQQQLEKLQQSWSAPASASEPSGKPHASWQS